MAATNRIHSLTLGSQTVRFAEFRVDGRGGLVLRDYRSSELMADPATEGARIPQTALAVKELVGGLKAAGQDVNYSIPSQSVFTRFVKLPSVGEEKVDQIVTFEAQQNVPFPIDEVVWDYQLVPSEESDKLEVVLVAIKSDLLDELNEAVESAPLKTGVVDVAPMALYNAFRYNYSDLSGCSLIVDIGARTTNLVFADGKKLFSRSIPIGGNTLTAAIAKDFNEPFAVAEERKKKQGFVSLGGNYADSEDPEVTRVSKTIRSSMTRLHNEIARSISFYRSQQGGNPPERVFLCGGVVGTPYMREFFNEKLSLPIEFFNPLRNVAVASGVDAEKAGREAHLLGEAVGLALRSGSDCPMELNLRPLSVVRAREMASRRPYLVMAGVSALLILVGWWVYLVQAATVEKAVLDSLEPKVLALKAVESKFTAARKEIKAKQEAVAPLIQAVEDRDYWVQLIDDLNTRLPARYIWITSMSVEQPKAPTGVQVPARSTGAAKGQPAASTQPSLVLKGLCLWNSDRGEAQGVLDGFVKNLSESPFFSLDLRKRNEIIVERVVQTNTEWTFGYTLRLPLKKSIEP